VVTDAEHPRNSGEADIELFQKHERTDRPLEKEQFIEKIEILLNRTLKLKKSWCPPIYE
jgi:hypothetical protein